MGGIRYGPYKDEALTYSSVDVNVTVLELHKLKRVLKWNFVFIKMVFRCASFSVAGGMIYMLHFLVTGFLLHAYSRLVPQVFT